ncbi:Retinal pigment epithelial membrane protein [Fusarium oxysporum f. sp. albedinis]|nr:Retinal pigment epithelial membrane protein [Fusarium oxysporum f. sp. albedinis]
MKTHENNEETEKNKEGNIGALRDQDINWRNTAYHSELHQRTSENVYQAIYRAAPYLDGVSHPVVLSKEASEIEGARLTAE